MKELKSNIELRDVLPNIGTLLGKNAERFHDKAAFRYRQDDAFLSISWTDLFHRVKCIAANLRGYGFSEGDKMVLFSPNRLEMLLMELAVMSSGGVAVPIFAYFKQPTATLLINHSDARFLAIAGQQQIENLPRNLQLKNIFVFDEHARCTLDHMLPFKVLLQDTQKDLLHYTANPNSICLNMYTSGTMGTPKCVQLTHRNILSQQAALDQVWALTEHDRFLSYLPWHHSFGGIFELFSALYRGATLTLESGYGKDPALLMQNWIDTKPTVFFSVPKVYEALIDQCRRDEDAEKAVFHGELKFVFTAAAPLLKNISDVFEKNHIPVYEGWGLTETSPCCTITDPKLKRIPGVVGKPLPGIHLRLTDDGEILVKGPNVMMGYYKNYEANKDAFTNDFWFRTGDVGEFTESGVKLLSRKDRIFKLSNGEKVIPSEVELMIHEKCHYISYVLVEGNGREYPVALLFPNKKLLHHPDYSNSPMQGCFCPRSLDELRKCLTGCLNDANTGIKQKFSKIRYASIINGELTVEDGTLTPSLKIAPRNVLGMYKDHLENLYGGEYDGRDEVYVVELTHPFNATDYA